MKKLLMIGAILALGTTMAYGAGKTATADVKVIAKIVDESFIISDLDGKDIVLDFQKIPAEAHELGEGIVKEISEGFMIKYTGTSSLTPNSSGPNLTFELKGIDKAGDSSNAMDGTPTVVTMRRQITTGDDGGEGNDIIKSNLFLGEYSATISGEINNQKPFYVGQIGAFIKGKDLKQNGTDAPAVGNYEGYAELKVTLTTQG